MKRRRPLRRGAGSPPRRKRAYTYILQTRDGMLYTGVTRDIVARLRRHNAGQGARYTKGRLPVRLVYQESHANLSAAMKRETQIKRLPRAKKRALIAGSRTLRAG